MFLLDSLLVDGLRFVMDKIAAVADAESQDDGALRERLLDAQMRVELGEMSDAEFADIERDVFERLRERRASGPEGGLSMTSGDGRVVAVEASVADDVDEAADRPSVRR